MASKGEDSVIRVRPVDEIDTEAWLFMRDQLWPDYGDRYHEPEIKKFFAGGLKIPQAVLLAEDSVRGVVGFVELSIRAYAEGCLTDHVGFLEGWYVIPELRRRGVGRALVAAAEAWARTQGCTEFASDALADNELSTTAHRALGFEEVEVIRCFRKNL
jgi:aminoglycoside 6'-N-acetyltransferase I